MAMETVYHLRVKEERAAQIIEELIEADAVENLVEEAAFALTPEQQKVVDAEIEKIEADRNYLIDWNTVKGRFIKP